MRNYIFGIGLAAAALVLAGCADPADGPQSTAAHPGNQRAIDQDISAARGQGQPYGSNVELNGVDSWRGDTANSFFGK